MSNQYCKISQLFFEQIYNTQGLFFSKISKINPSKLTEDLLNPIKAINQAELLQRYTQLQRKKVLEIGSGLGINHIVWTKKYNIDGFGIEPDEIGFESSYKISKELIELNGLEPGRIINAHGESIPFDNDSFDIVYSTNVLEHVKFPYKVLDEGLRVLKPNGIMQIVYPNYHSCFDGHYAIFHPPIFFKKFFPWYVKHIWQRDPEFAKNIRTELNVAWTKKHLNILKKKYQFEVISLGKDVFYERMRYLNFEDWAGLIKVKQVLSILNKFGLNKIVAKIMLLSKGWNPIILTIRKLPND